MYDQMSRVFAKIARIWEKSPSLLVHIGRNRQNLLRKDSFIVDLFVEEYDFFGRINRNIDRNRLRSELGFGLTWVGNQ
jgi:hypothetical protein